MAFLPIQSTGNSDRWSRPCRACPQALYTRGAFGGNGFFAAGRAPEWSQAEGIHFGLFVAAVFPRIAQAVFEAAGLFRQCPDEALTCRQRLRLPLEDRIFKGPPCVNPLPALIGE